MHLKKILCFCFLSWSLPASAVQVVVSIPPLAGLIAPLLDEGDTLEVLLKPGTSPHGFQLKPSDLWALHRSDLVVSVGTPVDAWLDKPLKQMKARIVEMNEIKGIQRLPVRRGGQWERKRDAGAQKHSDHEHHEDHQTHQEIYMDGHIWLAYSNARLLVKSLKVSLQQLKPEQAVVIEQKAEEWLEQLAQTHLQVLEQLRPYEEKGFVVLHDAYQYFEKQYHLHGRGSIRLNPEMAPSLKRIAELREMIVEQNIQCVFKEPQFPEKRVLAVVSGLNVRIGSLDPLGVYQRDGSLVPEGYKLYDRLLLDMAGAFERCLGDKESGE